MSACDSIGREAIVACKSYCSSEFEGAIVALILDIVSWAWMLYC